jgi:hypothetical protein
MKLRFVYLATAVAMLGLTMGCLYPNHGRGRPPRRGGRRDERRDDRRDRDHDDKRGRQSGSLQ